MYFKARYYAQSLGRFISADTIVPGAGNPQAFNRYAYGLNNPIRYTDPTGHKACDEQWGCEGKIPPRSQPPLLQSEILPSGVVSNQSLLNADGTGIPVSQVNATFSHGRFSAGCHVTFGCTTATEYHIRGYDVPGVKRILNKWQKADPLWKQDAEAGIWWGIDTVVAKGLPLSYAVRRFMTPDEKGPANDILDSVFADEIMRGHPTSTGFDSPNFDLVFIDNVFVQVNIVPTPDSLGWMVNWQPTDMSVLIVKPPDSIFTSPYLYIPLGTSRGLQNEIYKELND